MPVIMDPRIDAYITKAAPFALPILTHLRALVHGALPDAEEGIKWGVPHFMLGGKNVAAIAAFKAHCAFALHGEVRSGEGMGCYGKITSLAALPPDAELVAKLEEVAKSLAAGGRRAESKALPKPEIPMPEDFAAALAAAPNARATIDGFTPAQRRDYLEWIEGAKQATTRQRRIAQAIEWLAEGKRRNWKYESC